MENPRNERVTRTSYRYSGYDYADAGVYVFTANVDIPVVRLGRVHEKIFVPSAAGLIVSECWFRLAERFPTIQLDAFVVMPNHIHGIVFLGANPDMHVDDSSKIDFSQEKEERRRGPVLPSRDPHRPALGELIRSLKASSTARIRKECDSRFEWQPNYWDRILRNDRELERFRTYIENNPAQWESDKEYLPGDW